MVAAARIAWHCAGLMSAENYQNHLDRVSRSFAFCIAKLPQPFRERVGLAYLLCRILDTVEDALWPNSDIQMAAFDAFDQFLLTSASRSELEAWADTFPINIPEGEKLLIADAAQIFSDLHALTAIEREALLAPIQSMSKGMRAFSFARKNGELRLLDLQEANRYCFFVAGVVGEALSSLAKIHIVGFAAGEDNLIDAFHFGLFLQKINLLKDQRGDEKEGRYLVPSRTQMLVSAEENSRGALRYIQKLPVQARGFRLFCAWSYFLGLGSLPFLQKAFAEKSNLKISREQTVELLQRVEAVIDSNEKLEGLYKQALRLKLFPKASSKVESSASIVPAQFRSLYLGKLSDQGLTSLHLF